MALTRQSPSWTSLWSTNFLISGVILTKPLRDLISNVRCLVNDFIVFPNESPIKIIKQAQNSRSSSLIRGIETS
jgi:hypothetical protein